MAAISPLLIKWSGQAQSASERFFDLAKSVYF